MFLSTFIHHKRSFFVALGALVLIFAGAQPSLANNIFTKVSYQLSDLGLPSDATVTSQQPLAMYPCKATPLSFSVKGSQVKDLPIINGKDFAKSFAAFYQKKDQTALSEDQKKDLKKKGMLNFLKAFDKVDVAYVFHSNRQGLFEISSSVTALNDKKLGAPAALGERPPFKYSVNAQDKKAEPLASKVRALVGTLYLRCTS